MDKWWKNPVLQGEDNDYGDYDYLLNPLPANTHEWIKGKYRCESCGKYHYLNTRDTMYFYTYDGYDYMSYTECWKCVLATKINHLRKPFRKEFSHVRL